MKGQYGEPWKSSGTSGMVLHRKSRDRAVACVNAMDGLNPEGVAGLVEAATNASECAFLEATDHLPAYFLVSRANMGALRAALAKFKEARDA